MRKTHRSQLNSEAYTLENGVFIVYFGYDKNDNHPLLIGFVIAYLQ